MARTLVGTVASDKTDKTIIVAVETRKTHPIYKKQYTVTKRFAAHDEKNEAHEGDKVSIVEVRPMSATKRFSLEKIIAKAGVQHVDETTVQAKPVSKKKSVESDEVEE